MFPPHARECEVPTKDYFRTRRKNYNFWTILLNPLANFIDVFYKLWKTCVEILDTMITQQQLETIGLPEEEAVIYHSLLHHGSMGLQAIAHTTGIRRTTLYPLCSKLDQEGDRDLFG